MFNEALNADNTLNDSDYSTNTHRQNGVRPGVADSKTHNKLFRQVSIMAVALANFINSQDLDALDQDVTDLSNNLSKALDKISSIPLKEHREKTTIDHPDKSVTNAKLADNAVNARTIINKSVTNEKLADNAVNTSNIINKSITADKLDKSYLPITGGTVSGRTHIDSMLSVGQSSAVASNIRVDSTAGNAYIALLNYNNVGNLLIDGYFSNPETAMIDVTNRNAQGTVRYRSTLMDGKGNAKFANDVYANEKLLATKEYVDGKKWGAISIIDGAVTPTKLDRPYLPLTGGTLTGALAIVDGNNGPHYIGPGGGTSGGNLNLGSATKTKSTALCCINRPMWWNNNSSRSLALEEDINTHNASSSAHKPILDAIKAITGTNAFNTAPSKKITEIITLLGQGGIVSSKLDATAGFVKFANRFTIQWGKSDGISTNPGKLIQFPIAFNTIFGVFAMPIYTSSNLYKNTLALNYVNTTNFKVMSDDVTTNCFWTAIGLI